MSSNNPRGRSCARLVTVCFSLLLGAGLTTQASAPVDDSTPTGDELDRIVIRDAEVGAPVTPTVYDGDLRDLPAAPQWRPGDPIREIPMRHYLPPGALPPPEPTSGVDPLLQRQLEAAADATRGSFLFTSPTRNFSGMGYSGVNPPDTVGDVGPDHFVQSINTGGGADVRVFNKAQPTPGVIATFRLDTLGSGQCASGFGDPIVLYDRQAERWMIAEFSGSGNELCVYISQTPDPVTGGWYAYNFAMPSFPDYPKFAVWATDANGGDGSYVVTANDGGPGVIALDRGRMLVGQSASFKRLAMPGLPGFGIQGPTPADPDGPNGPPANASAIVMRHRDTEVHGGPPAPGDLLEMWELDVDWVSSGNTTLTQAPSIHVSEFDSAVCGTAFVGCFSQPGSATKLMPIREVIMNRLQYYNHGAFESLVGNFTVDVNATDLGGVRWFELRRSGGGAWTLHQEGTYSIDTDNRWMAAIAMDQSENIALAYNIVSSSTFPSLRYTGREADDAPGVMTQSEASIHAGSAANSSFRYGDYAAMGLDPEDDCTFWFTGMDNTSSNWRTQAASFRFDRCGCLLEPETPTVDATAFNDNEVELFWEDSNLETVTSYRVDRSRTPGGPYETIATVADSSPGFAGGAGYTFVDTDVSGSVTYYYVVVADDGLRCQSDVAGEVEITALGLCNLRPIFGGLAGTVSSALPTCAVNLDWSAATAECGGPIAHNVYRSTTPGFTPGPENLLAGGILGTSAVDANALQDGTIYHYIVRAIDLANGLEDLNTVETAALAGGPGSGLQTVYFEDFETSETFSQWTISTGPGPHRCGPWTRGTTANYRPAGSDDIYAITLSQDCAQFLPQTSTKIDSPPVNMNITGLFRVYLEADLYYKVFNGDDATVEVWDGSAWHIVWADPNTDFNQHVSIDVTQYAQGNSGFRVRLNYQNAAGDRWFSVDNVAIVADVQTPCTPGLPVPPAGADGLTAVRDDVAGSTLTVGWDASCGAAGYDLLWGDLDGVTSLDVNGSVCGLGSSGTLDWNAVPAGSIWFVIVGNDGAGTESSWGSSSFGERGGLSASGECGTMLKDVTATCP